MKKAGVEKTAEDGCKWKGWWRMGRAPGSSEELSPQQVPQSTSRVCHTRAVA